MLKNAARMNLAAALRRINGQAAEATIAHDREALPLPVVESHARTTASAAQCAYLHASSPRALGRVMVGDSGPRTDMAERLSTDDMRSRLGLAPVDGEA